MSLKLVAFVILIHLLSSFEYAMVKIVMHSLTVSHFPCRNTESDEGIEVITELPQKRPKVRPRKAQSDVVGKRTKLSTHPTLCNKRQQIKQGSNPHCATTTAEGNTYKP